MPLLIMGSIFKRCLQSHSDSALVSAMLLEIGIVFVTRTKVFENERNFCEQWCRLEKKRTMDERLESFRKMKKISFLKQEQTI